MFNKLRYKIALQFTVVTLFLLILNGFLFIPIDYHDYLSELDENIQQDAQRIISLLEGDLDDVSSQLRARDKIRVRAFDKDGDVTFAGSIYGSQEDTLQMEPWSLCRLWEEKVVAAKLS